VYQQHRLQRTPPAQDTVASLIAVNTQLGQHEAARGILIVSRANAPKRSSVQVASHSAPSVPVSLASSSFNVLPPAALPLVVPPQSQSQSLSQSQSVSLSSSSSSLLAPPRPVSAAPVSVPIEVAVRFD
jgi:hypothetical protein